METQRYTETLLCCGDNVVLNELLPSGYDIRHVDRERRGGCVALIYKKRQFELLDCIIKVNKLSTKVDVVYRPPPAGKNGRRYDKFAIEWSS